MLLRRMVAFAVVALMLALAGRSDGQPLQKIKVMTRAGSNFTKGTEVAAIEFTKRTGIQVEIVEVGRAGYFATLTTRFSGADSEMDLGWMVSPNMAKYAAAGGLEPLDKYVADPKLTPADWDAKDFLTKCDYAGKTYMYPVFVGTEYTYYRKDLMSKPPETWDEYLEMAKKFTKALNPSSPTLYGAVWPNKSPEELQRTFMTVVFSSGGYVYDEAKKTVGLDEPAAIRAGETYAKFVKARLLPVDAMNYAFTEITDGLKAGKFAIAAPMWDNAFLQIRTSDSPFKDMIEVAPVPGFKQPDGSIKSSAMQQSWGLVINSQSKNKEAAYKFLNFMQSKEIQRIIFEQAGLNPPRASVLNDPRFLGKPGSAHFKLLAQVLANSHALPSITWLPELEEKLGPRLGDILTGAAAPADALKSAAADIRKLASQNP